MIYPVLFLIGGAIYRIRGGFLTFPSTQIARLVWSAFVAVITFAAMGDYLLSAATGAASFAGLALIGHGYHQWLGKRPFTDTWTTEKRRKAWPSFFIKPYTKETPMLARFWHDVAGMAVIGVTRMAFVAMPLMAAGFFNAAMLIPAGLLHGAAYALGGLFPMMKQPAIGKETLIGRDTEWAEFIWGGMQAIAIYGVLS